MARKLRSQAGQPRVLGRCAAVGIALCLWSLSALAQPLPKPDAKPDTQPKPKAQQKLPAESQSKREADPDAPPDARDAPADPKRFTSHDDPPQHEGVVTLLDQSYLTELERASLRVEFGVWTAGDLADPALAARAALLRGSFHDPSLASARAVPMDRAEALLCIGKPAQAVALIDAALAEPASAAATRKPEPQRATRLKAQALLDLGKVEDAEKLLAGVAESMNIRQATDAGEIAESARSLVLLAHLRGAEGEGAMGYQDILQMLAGARESLDQLSWRVQLAEAILLFEKDNFEEAGGALESVLALNPRCAEAWALFGEFAVRTFDFDRAERIALRLDELAALPTLDLMGPPYPPAPASLGSLTRSALRVRQIEGAEARAELVPWLSAFPQHREALALQAAASATAFDFPAARAQLRALDDLSPGSPLGYLAAGKALASARQYEEAAEYLREAAVRAPRWAEPRIELGLSEVQAGHLTAAHDALREGLKLDRFNVRAANSMKLIDELEPYAKLDSEHFIVRHKQGVDEVLAREMLPVLERIFTRVCGDSPGGIRHEPKGKTVVELYPNHRWFATRITGMPALHTFAAATGPVIAMETPRSGPGHLVGPYDWARVVQHEYTHTVTLSRTRNRLPHWFTEASAVFLEDAPKDFNMIKILTGALRANRLFDFDTINVMFVRPKRQTDRGQAYGQGAWMYEYLIERFGPQAPLDLMDLYATGVREPEAFQKVLKVSREQFLSDFTLWATTQAQAWGMIASPANPSLAVLLESDGEKPDPDAEAGDAQLKALREKHPKNPFVLEELFTRMVTLQEAGAAVSGDDVQITEQFALARPVDPAPHKFLAAYYLSGEGLSAGHAREEAIEHLEFLDAREQHATSYAVELARFYVAQGKGDLAVKKAARATQLSPYDGTIRELGATICLRAKQPREAERHILALTLLEPEREIHKQRLEAVKKMP